MPSPHRPPSAGRPRSSDRRVPDLRVAFYGDDFTGSVDALRQLVVQYKACSTADSSPAVGSLGRVIEVARDVFGPAPVPVLFAQPDFGRFTAFGHHFAAEGGT